MLALSFSFSAGAQGTAPAGIIAFVGVDAAGSASVYVLDLASGRMGQIIVPVTSEVDLAWHPEGDALAFTTQDGGYGLLRSLRGCFDAAATCLDTLEVLPPFIVQELEWSPDGEMLYFASDDGMKVSPPRARPNEIDDVALDCPHGFAASGEPLHLICAAEDTVGNVQVSIYQAGDPDLTKLYDLGVFPQITGFDVGPDGRSAAGTQESAGDSGFYAPADGSPARLAAYQIHIYDLQFKPDGTSLAIIGATSDSTGDGTLRDDDPAELFLYDPVTGQLNQVAGFTGATAVTWSPDGEYILAVIENRSFRIHTPAAPQIPPVNVSLPQPGLQVSAPAWNPAQAGLPFIPTATPGVIATRIPTLTPAATLTPLPTLTPIPVFPTFTPFPSATPGSPIGLGCQYVYSGAQPVNVGDTAEVTSYGAAVRFRAQAALSASMIRELSPGTRMTILSGPYCADGYRWWQAQLQADGRIGYLADSDPSGYWIKKVEPTAPTLPAESIYFYADRYSITPGECVTVRWDLEGIREVYFEGTGVTGHDSRVVCPGGTTTYTLRIVRLDGSEIFQQVTIVVTPAY
jgi:WD40 repeat protein